MVLEVILAAATLAGGGAAIWFFVDKARAVQWKQPHFERAIKPSTPEFRVSGDVSSGWPILRIDPVFPEEVRSAVLKFEPSFRLPRGIDIRDDWAEYGDPSTLFPFLCQGSFSGRNKREYAVILPGGSNQGYKIVALVRNKPGTLEPVELQTSERDVPWNLFIRSVPAGRYRPGPSATDLGSPTQFKISNDGINTGAFESADSIFFWDRKRQGFQQVWMSD